MSRFCFYLFFCVIFSVFFAAHAMDKMLNVVGREGSSEPVGSLHEQLDQASALRLEISCESLSHPASLESIREKYKQLRSLLENIIAVKHVLRSSPRAVSDDLTPDENVWIRIWLAEILADGLGGNADLFRAQKLCQGLLETHGYVLRNLPGGDALYEHVCHILNKVKTDGVRKVESCEFGTDVHESFES